MKKLLQKVLIVCAVLLTTSACEMPVGTAVDETTDRLLATDPQPLRGDAASKASVEQTRIRFSLPLQLSIPCIDEEVSIGGGVRHLTVTEISNENGFVYRLHLNHSQITGVGTETGDEYVGQFVLNETLVSFTELGGTQTFRMHVHGVSKGSGPNFFISVLMHLTLDAGGNLTAETEIVEAECRG